MKMIACALFFNLIFGRFLHGSTLKNQDIIALAIDCTISEVQAGKTTLCLSRTDVVKRFIAQIETTVVRLTVSCSGAIKIIRSIPGISRLSAIVIFF